MFVLRLWMWAVPLLMLTAALIFAAIAASNGSWGLFVIMLVMALTAVALFLFHWWVLYRFGRPGRGQLIDQRRNHNDQPQ